ncbi:MAG: T9SS type A sorting domain-containing protein [Bacteroidales bacterium]|nr:T9SS type A sorting domain-containing protein [Bacteroidales bacterium]
MKKQIIILSILGMLIILPITNYAQIVSFSYDDTGNRTQREIIFIGDKDNSDSITTQFNSIIDEVTVTIFPNPNGGKFSVEIQNTDEDFDASLLLHTLSGTLIIKEDNLSKLTNVDISKYENGTYLLSIIINDKKETWKVVKR